MTDPYGSPQPQPWGTPSNQPPTPAAAQPGYPGAPAAPQGYPGPVAPQPGYPGAAAPGQYPPAYAPQPFQPAGYGYPPAAYAPAAPEKRSPVLGIIGLAVTALATVGSVVAAIPVGEVLAHIVAFAGTTNIGPEDVPPDLVAQINGPMSALVSLAGLGFVGWIIGIIAAATGRGRTWGVLAIVLGIVAPFIILFTLAGAMLPVIESIP